MGYIEVCYKLEPLLPAREILYAELGDRGFEAFEDTQDGVRAYIKKEQFSKSLLKDLSINRIQGQKIEFDIITIANQNWNAVWESNFNSIVINSNCIIRAPFHPVPALEYDIIISPQMSFGTGHHETTFLMSKELFSLDLKSVDLLDMGSGTGVLGILAEKLGAKYVKAIDIEEGAFLNTIDNCKLNNTKNIIVEKGDSKLLVDSLFDVILANINKNILLQDISVYSNCLKLGGKLLLSGFFTTDIDELRKAASNNGLKFVKTNEKNNWAMIMLEKL
ncbi:MAG: 50S ribosomal protein L11 methyltransferase [Flavobacteriales bacterium]|nr:50S ribosomal protein L11 methyltransferase [Flavobacteriales bacterium]